MIQPQPFITYLEGLREDRGALAALRRGLGQPPGDAREMYPYVVRWLPAEASAPREAAYFLVAALFAYHSGPDGSGNLGQAFRRTLDPNDDNTAIERRFIALLTAHPDDLPFYLRQAISFLKSKEVPVDWHQLFADELAWGHPAGSVQKQWARAFWGRPTNEEQTQNKE
jgi:CRISPR type I-E-associated protein CasB/Cse2